MYGGIRIGAPRRRGAGTQPSPLDRFHYQRPQHLPRLLSGGRRLVARLTPKVPSLGRPVRGGGVGFATRESQRKRYRDLDSEAAALADKGTNPLQLRTVRNGVNGSLELPSVLSVPLFHPPESGGSRDESATRHLMLARADFRAVPGLAWALGASTDRPWQVSGLLRALAA